MIVWAKHIIRGQKQNCNHNSNSTGSTNMHLAILDKIKFCNKGEIQLNTFIISFSLTDQIEKFP